MRLGVVGLGVIGPYFLRAARNSTAFTLAAVCDRDPAKLVPFAGSKISTFLDIEDLIAAGAADVVVVTLPNDQHHPVVARALAAGLHVCCEKPLTVRAADARELAALADHSGLTLFTASHRRHNVHLRQLARAIAGADVAEVRCRYFERIEEHVGDERWYLSLDRCGGGCLVDNGPNAIDCARVLVGELEVADCTLADIRDGVEFRAEVALRGTGASGASRVAVELDWTWPHGQLKDVSVRLRDGRTLSADLLAGFDGLKGSLDHEYAGVLDTFAALVRQGRSGSADGVAVVELVEQAYAVAR
jgi:predicted dehydrogenase